MNEEIMRVLKMVEEGKNSADKDKEIIDALGKTTKTTQVISTKRYEYKFLKVKILSNEGDKVNVNLHIKIIKEVMKATGKLPISESIDSI